MLFYIQMRWNIEGRATLEDIFALELDEAVAVGGQGKVIGMYKVAAQRRVIAIMDLPSADELDRTFMARLPLREYLELEAVWSLRQFDDFVDDCATWVGSAANRQDGSSGEGTPARSSLDIRGVSGGSRVPRPLSAVAAPSI